MDVFKSFGSKLFGKTMKKAAKTAATKAVTTAATKTGEHVGETAGDKIIEFLSKRKMKNTPKKVSFIEPTTVESNPRILERYPTLSIKRNPIKPNKITQQDINQRLNLILSDD